MDLPFPMGPDRESPLPDDLPAAREEILRLRRALISDRDRLAKMAERRAGDNRAAAGTQRALREEIAALKHLQNESLGPGTPTARWHWLMDELQARFPDPEPHRSDRGPEQYYLAVIDQLITFKAVHGGEACLEERAAGNGPCGACSVCVKELQDELARWKTEENEDGSPADSDCAHPELCGFCRARAHRLQVLGLRLDNLKKYVAELPCSEDCEPEDGWCECVREPLLSMIEKGHP